MTRSAEQAPSPEGASQARYPDFFIVGHAKCGTTALYEMLRRHPDVFMPEVKEPQFFARNLPELGDEPPRSRFEQTGRVPETLAQYLSLFAAARPDQRVGEASTFYLWSRVAAARIAERRPDARIVAVLREPASFLHSLHLQMQQNGVETESSLRRALTLEGARREGREIPAAAHWPEALMYSERVRYVEQLRRYEAVFPRDQILVLVYDDFRSDNLGTLRRVERFLGIDEDVPVEELEANPTVRVRSERLRGALRAAYRADDPLSRALKASLRGLVPTDTRQAARRRLIFGRAPAADEQLAAELRARFKGEVVALSEYLGRDLVELWGYDRID
jgi:hypothetical protein